MDMKQMSDLTQIYQQQCLENKKLEKFFSYSKRKSLQLSLALNQKEGETSSDPLDTFLVSEVSGSYYVVAEGRNYGSFGIYVDVDVGKFLSEVDCMAGALFRVYPTYPASRLYLEVHQGRGGEPPPSQNATYIGRLWAEPRPFQSRRKGRITTFSEQACCM
jgi:hypothetical protein